MLKSLKLLAISGLLACPLNLSALEQPASAPSPERWKIDEQNYPAIETIIARESKDYPVYGIYTWFGEYMQLRESIKKVGWQVIRMGGPKTYENVAAIMEDGLVFSFMAPAPKSPAEGQKGRRDVFESDEAYIEASKKALHKFMDDYGQGGKFYDEYPQFKGRYIPFMQLRNEPNFHYMWKKGSEDQRQKLYAKLAPALTDIIKERSPKTKVIGFSAGGAGAGDMRFVKAVADLDPRCVTEIDVFSTHPYVDPAPPEYSLIEKWGSYSIARGLHVLRSTFKKHGNPDLTVWYTEAGFQLHPNEGGHFSGAKKSTYLTADFQAAYNIRYYALALRLGVAAVTQMFICDSDGNNGGFFDRHNKMKWRKNAFAVQAMTMIMPHPKLRGAQADGEDSTFIYEFAKNAKASNSPSVIMAFRATGAKTVTIAVGSAKAKVSNMYGESKIIDTKDGALEIEIGPFPTYIEKK